MSPSQIPSRPGPWRRRVVLAGWLVGAAVLCVRAAQIQLAQRGSWQELAESQHRTDKRVAAARGTILDRDGTPLAVSRETYSVGVATDQVTDAQAVQNLLVAALELSPEKARSVTDTDRRWNPIAGRYGPATRERLAGVRGLYLDRELQRYYPHGDLARGLLGTVIDEAGQGGIEQAFDDVLRGHAGREVVARDVVGQPIPGETFVVEDPRAGGEVVLTIDLDLQEIARQALEEAIESTEARGGDVLVTDPMSGEILALVSIRDGQTASLSAINTPYEPGSTLKPFTVAAILSNGVGALSDTVDTEDGTWVVNQRRLDDSGEQHGRMSVADALRVSSNVGIAKAAQPLTEGQQYENLRDFGFGVPTGIEIPGEAGGVLRRPDRWSGQSPASLAIGYEISVTPLQMAMAYGAMANGGRLMKPHLVKEIRNAGGDVVASFGPRVVRRVVDARVTRSISRVLVDVVEDGSGTAARLGSFRVAGKSGTARAYSPEDGGYTRGNYYSSFVGFFPAEDPQLVILVKLENPQGAYYGGAVAAPVTRATMEAALAARSSPLDRAALVQAMRSPPVPATAAPTRFAAQSIDPPAPPAYEALVAAGFGGDPAAVGVPIPEVVGLSSRVAARRLHALGLRVEHEGSGEIIGTVPAAGLRALPGDTIRLRVRRRLDG